MNMKKLNCVALLLAFCFAVIMIPTATATYIIDQKTVIAKQDTQTFATLGDIIEFEIPPEYKDRIYHLYGDCDPKQFKFIRNSRHVLAFKTLHPGYKTIHIYVTKEISGPTNGHFHPTEIPVDRLDFYINTCPKPR